MCSPKFFSPFSPSTLAPCLGFSTIFLLALSSAYDLHVPRRSAENQDVHPAPLAHCIPYTRGGLQFEPIILIKRESRLVNSFSCQAILSLFCAHPKLEAAARDLSHVVYYIWGKEFTKWELTWSMLFPLSNHTYLGKHQTSLEKMSKYIIKCTPKTGNCSKGTFTRKKCTIRLVHAVSWFQPHMHTHTPSIARENETLPK